MIDPFGYYRWHDILFWVRDWGEILRWDEDRHDWVADGDAAWRTILNAQDPSREELTEDEVAALTA